MCADKNWEIRKTAGKKTNAKASVGVQEVKSKKKTILVHWSFSFSFLETGKRRKGKKKVTKETKGKKNMKSRTI